MQSARQKKKSSQQRKRHHEHVKAKGLAKGVVSTEAKPKDKGEQVKQDQSTPQTIPQEASLLAKAKVCEHQCGKGSSMWESRLGSNWDRYEEPGDDQPERSYYEENEEQLQQRLVQLLNLPIHHVPPPPLDGASESVQQLGDSDSFLSLDVPGLAACLSSIPLHQILGLSPDLMQLCSMDTEPGNAESALPTAAAPPEIDLSVCTKKREYTFEFKAPERPSLVSMPSAKGKDGQFHFLTESASSVGNRGEGIPEENEVLEKGGMSGRLGGSVSSVLVSDPADMMSRPAQNCSCEDEALDRLLTGQLESGLKELTRRPSGEHRRPAQDCSQEHETLLVGQTGSLVHSVEPTPAQGPSKSTAEHTPSGRPAQDCSHKDETLQEGMQTPTGLAQGQLVQAECTFNPTVDVAELDDMLDELLS